MQLALQLFSQIHKLETVYQYHKAQQLDQHFQVPVDTDFSG
jgi:hypothetical protein